MTAVHNSQDEQRQHSCKAHEMTMMSAAHGGNSVSVRTVTWLAAAQRARGRPDWPCSIISGTVRAQPHPVNDLHKVHGDAGHGHVLVVRRVVNQLRHLVQPQLRRARGDIVTSGEKRSDHSTRLRQR